MHWQSTKSTIIPENTILNTAQEVDGKKENIQKLIKKGNLWWTPDMQMYVYYTPSHWSY